MRNFKESSFIDILSTLCMQVGISGHEQYTGISRKIYSIAKNISSETEIDKFGNVVAIVGKGPKRILLDAHLDEIGFMVSNIDKDNIWISPIGDVNPNIIEGSNVLILEGNIKGKIGVERDKLLFIPSVISEKGKISTGDLISFERNYAVKGRTIEAIALDNRVGCAVLLELMRVFSSKELGNLSIVFSFSTQEEKDCSTLNKIADRYKPEFGIIIDAAYAYPVDFDDKDMSIPELGKGCAIQYQGKDFIVSSEVTDYFEILAKENNILFQKEIPSPKIGRTNFPQLHKSGILSGVINIPVAYQHREKSLLNLDDAINAFNLIDIFLETQL